MGGEPTQKPCPDRRQTRIPPTGGKGNLERPGPEERGREESPADTQGEGKIRLDGSYLADALRACGGMVELKLVDSKSPMLFTSPDYELVVMPMFAGESQTPKGEAQTAEPVKVETEPAENTEPEAEIVSEAEKAEAVAEAEAITKADKPKHKAKRKAKEPVAVA